MKIARKILGGLGAAAVLSASLLWMLNPTASVLVSEDELQNEISARLPHSRQVGPAMVTVNSADLYFGSAGRLRVKAAVEVQGSGIDEDVSINVVTGIRYDRGNVYLTDIDLSDITLVRDDATEAATGGMARLRSQLMTRALPSMIQQLETRLHVDPVADLREMGWKGQFAALVMKDIKFDKKGLRIDVALSNLPLHVLLGMIALIFAGSAKWIGRQRD